MNNKTIGNAVEKEFARAMFVRGWWVHILAYNANGQPFDVIMSRNNISWFLDVKNVESGDSFRLDRVEENQMTSFRLLTAMGTTNCGLAIKFDDKKFYLLEYRTIVKLKEAGVPSVSKYSMKVMLSNA